MPTIEYDPEVHDELAVRVRDLIRTNPTLTINLLSSQLEAHMDDVTLVLDGFDAEADPPEWAGPGLGHGWIEEEQRAALVKEGTLPDDAAFLGWRWPDNQLRTIPFDRDNEAHVKLVEESMAQ
jgi:hypothetical protein